MVVEVHLLVHLVELDMTQPIEVCRHHLEKLGHYTLITLVVMELMVVITQLVEVVVLALLELMDPHQEMVVLDNKLI
tara:strand:- start:458 stop:688 length:231 start_codon:yes stop_codon:yes gene_type:complete